LSKLLYMLWFISGAEIVFVFFIVLLVFGADKIPSIARTLAKGMTQVRQATNDIKNEIQKSVDIESPTKKVTSEIKKEVDQLKGDFDDLKDSISRDL
jgi:sec-independent protein translocase protein TatA